MHQSQLNDAAIALARVLDKHAIYFGFFGGYAISANGGQRECQDIDCLAGATKQQMIDVLDGKEGFIKAPIQTRFIGAPNQTSEDYVVFLWSAQPNRKNEVLVEIWCDRFPGAKHSLSGIRLVTIPLNGQVTEFGASSFFTPFHIFKGKVHAAAQRDNFHDAADLRWLETRYSQEIRVSKELNIKFVGLAMKRYPELETQFTRLGIDVMNAKKAAANLDPNKLPKPAPGDVQEGLLG